MKKNKDGFEPGQMLTFDQINAMRNKSAKAKPGNAGAKTEEPEAKTEEPEAKAEE